MANSGPVPWFDLRKGGLMGLRWVVAAAQRHNEAGIWVSFFKKTVMRIHEFATQTRQTTTTDDFLYDIE